MRIAGASRGWLRREQYQGGIGRRPLSRPSSSFVLLGRLIPGFARVRGARKVDAFSVALFSLPRGMEQGGLGVSAQHLIRRRSQLRKHLTE